MGKGLNRVNSDGWGFNGAGASDMRQAGKDLQHAKQTRTADENPTGEQKTVRQQSGSGGPMKEALDQELARHRESKDMRVQHLQEHYKR